MNRAKMMNIDNLSLESIKYIVHNFVKNIVGVTYFPYTNCTHTYF